jgi:hypothetical protein
VGESRIPVNGSRIERGGHTGLHHQNGFIPSDFRRARGPNVPGTVGALGIASTRSGVFPQRKNEEKKKC